MRWRAEKPPEFRSRPGWLIASTCRCNMCAKKRKDLVAARRSKANCFPASAGKSKVNFINALREAGGTCDHCFVIFFYDIYPQGKKILGDLGVTMHALTTWRDVLAVAKASGKFEAKMLAEVEKFIDDPAGWSKAHGGAAEAAE
jgi:hypothetical protein